MAELLTLACCKLCVRNRRGSLCLRPHRRFGMTFPIDWYDHEKNYDTRLHIDLRNGCWLQQEGRSTPVVAEVAQPKPAVAPAAPVATAATPAPEQTPEQHELAVKQSLMDYATMEDKFINDPRAQWANSAKATSTFGDGPGKTPSDSNLAINAKGVVDGKTWTNGNIELGFDSLELAYDKPVNATEVRVVLPAGDGAEAISKVELQDTSGAWNTVWSGISEVKRDKRGNRTWFVRSFDKTTYKAKGVKVTFANNLEHVYKVVDAVQLVGE